MNDFFSLVRDRYSCRQFTPEPPSEADIERILTAARLAPTAVNKQPAHVWVVQSDDARARLFRTTKYGFDVSSFDPALLRELFPETAGYEIVALFPTGHPAVGPSPRHDDRLPLEETTTRL